MSAVTELPRRVRVVGNSGSGKTTFAERLSVILQLPHLELDSVMHRAGWVEAPPDEFRAEVREFVARSPVGWVVDGNYQSRIGDELAGTDTWVWLDYPRRTVMWRVVRRTLGRLLLGRELWNGNRESWRNVMRLDPNDNIVLWSWTQHHDYRSRYLERMAESGGWVHLRSPRQARHWLAEVERLEAAE